MSVGVVYSIGHSTSPVEHLLGRLKRCSIGVVCDVRSTPYSRFSPQYNREALKAELAQVGIRYIFLGRELGARTEDKSCYRNGQVQYELLAQTDLFRSGIDRIKVGSESFSVAIMCAEKEPLDCHRTILVARELCKRSIEVRHILADGKIETHSDSMLRLVRLLGIPGADMFRPKEDVMAEAYALRGRQIAYQEKDFDSSGSVVVDESIASRIGG